MRIMYLGGGEQRAKVGDKAHLLRLKNFFSCVLATIE